jgi:hypothetical protein
MLMVADITVQVLTLDELEPAVTYHFGSARVFEFGTLPSRPGVYVWFSDSRVVYIGSAKSLSQRAGWEQGEVKSYEPATEWHYSVIHALKIQNAQVGWITTSDHSDAELLERRLIEWHRTCTGIAPIAVGWDAKKDSPPRC